MLKKVGTENKKYVLDWYSALLTLILTVKKIGTQMVFIILPLIWFSAFWLLKKLVVFRLVFNIIHLNFTDTHLWLLNKS